MHLPILVDCDIYDTYFYRAALNAGRSSREKAVCLSVCLNVRLI